MLKNDCTIPFIARYRRDQTGGLDADQLRHVKDAYDHIKYVFRTNFLVLCRMLYIELFFIYHFKY